MGYFHIRFEPQSPTIRNKNSSLRSFIAGMMNSSDSVSLAFQGKIAVQSAFIFHVSFVCRYLLQFLNKSSIACPSITLKDLAMKYSNKLMVLVLVGGKSLSCCVYRWSGAAETTA